MTKRTSGRRSSAWIVVVLCLAGLMASASARPQENGGRVAAPRGEAAVRCVPGPCLPRAGVPPVAAGTPPGLAVSGEGSLAGVADGGLDWVDAIRIAVARHPSVAGAAALLRQQSDMVDVARAGYRPRVQAGISSGEQGEFGFGQVATVGVTQMLYDFGKVASQVSREEAAVRRQRASMLQAIDTVIERTAQALVEAHRFQELERIAQEQVVELRKIMEITELRAEAGVAPESEPVQARARVEAAQALSASMSAQLRQWRGRLSMYLGPALPAAVAPAPQEIADADAFAPVAHDLRELPAMRIAEARHDEALADMAGARAQAFPTLSLDVDMNKRLGAAGERYEQIYGKSTYASANLSVNAPLYQGGELAARRRAGANAVAAALADRETASLDAEHALSTLREQIAGLDGRLSLLEGRVGHIARTRALYRDQYLALGTRNALDLLNAEQEVALAAQDLVNARHDLWEARVGYLLASGQARSHLGVHAATGLDPEWAR